MIVETKIINKVKVVTIRSTRRVENNTNVELEVGFFKKGQKKPTYTKKIKPSETFWIPIESAYHDIIFIRPAEFGYYWSRQGLYWKDVIGKKKHNGILF
jgi:hypothetical protein